MPRWEQAGMGDRSWGSQLGPEEEGNTPVMRRVLQTPRKRKTRHSSNPPMECHVGWVMDSREHRPRTASIRYQRQACRIVEEARMGKAGSVGRKGKGAIWSCRGGLLLGDCRKDRDQTCPSWKGLEKIRSLGE